MALVGFLGGLLLGLLDLYPFMIPLQEVITHAFYTGLWFFILGIINGFIILLATKGRNFAWFNICLAIFISLLFDLLIYFVLFDIGLFAILVIFTLIMALLSKYW